MHTKLFVTHGLLDCLGHCNWLHQRNTFGENAPLMCLDDLHKTGQDELQILKTSFTLVLDHFSRAFFLFFFNWVPVLRFTVTPLEPNMMSANLSLMTAHCCPSVKMEICSVNRVVQKHHTIGEKRMQVKQFFGWKPIDDKIDMHTIRKLEPIRLMTFTVHKSLRILFSLNPTSRFPPHSNPISRILSRPHEYWQLFPLLEGFQFVLPCGLGLFAKFYHRNEFIRYGKREELQVGGEEKVREEVQERARESQGEEERSDNHDHVDWKKDSSPVRVQKMWHCATDETVRFTFMWVLVEVVVGVRIVHCHQAIIFHSQLWFFHFLSQFSSCWQIVSIHNHFSL